MLIIIKIIKIIIIIFHILSSNIINLNKKQR